MAPFNGLGMHLGNLSRLSPAKTRSISPENFDGAKGGGGRATEGTGAMAARDLGVKQAPFVVLIGASMPSVLAEISFVTNPADAQLLRNGNHRQKIAESLYEAVVKYQRTLKVQETVALQQ